MLQSNHQVYWWIIHDAWFMFAFNILFFELFPWACFRWPHTRLLYLFRWFTFHFQTVSPCLLKPVSFLRFCSLMDLFMSLSSEHNGFSWCLLSLPTSWLYEFIQNGAVSGSNASRSHRCKFSKNAKEAFPYGWHNLDA